MIICLRPQPDCNEDVAELNKRGVQALALPMLKISYVAAMPTQLTRPDQLSACQGLIITSKQASRYLSAQLKTCPDLRRVAIWCVGSGSAEILRQAGCQIVWQGSGSAADLADQISAQATATTKTGQFFWLSGRDIHLDIAARLQRHAIRVDRLIVYRTDRLARPHHGVQDQLISGRPMAAAVFSARTLIQFQQWLAEYAPATDISSLTILAASSALAEQARTAGYPAQQADRPDRYALLHLCEDWFQQTFF